MYVYVCMYVCMYVCIRKRLVYMHIQISITCWTLFLILNQEAWICLRTPSSNRLLRSLQIHLAEPVEPSPGPRKTWGTGVLVMQWVSLYKHGYAVHRIVFTQGHWDQKLCWLVYEPSFSLTTPKDALYFIQKMARQHRVTGIRLFGNMVNCLYFFHGSATQQGLRCPSSRSHTSWSQMGTREIHSETSIAWPKSSSNQFYSIPMVQLL